MRIRHRGATPMIDATVRVAPNAIICGDVTIGPNTSIGFGAVITAESGPVRIGANCVVMDTAVIRGVRNNPVMIGNNVLVGPRAYLVGCTIEDEAFLATGATVFNGARVGKGAEVRINGTVHLRTVVPPGETVPINWIAVGDPVTILPPDRHDEIWAIQKELDFPGYVFGVDRPPSGESVMPAVMPRYAGALRRWHGDDEEVTGSSP
jgi:carbonic anhydrase/acetyltransferase-like protein (isoleucine patch superfamily)